MGDVLAAIKAAPPGKFKASGTGQGGIWHLALAGWLRDEGRPGQACPGCPATVPRPACRTWWPAASNSRRCRCPKRAR
jgi:hypothetical protein